MVVLEPKKHLYRVSRVIQLSDFYCIILIRFLNCDKKESNKFKTLTTKSIGKIVPFSIFNDFTVRHIRLQLRTRPVRFHQHSRSPDLPSDLLRCHRLLRTLPCHRCQLLHYLVVCQSVNTVLKLCRVSKSFSESRVSNLVSQEGAF